MTECVYADLQSIIIGIADTVDNNRYTAHIPHRPCKMVLLRNVPELFF